MAIPLGGDPLWGTPLGDKYPSGKKFMRVCARRAYVSKETKLHADDISCSHCAATIKRELGVVEGVVSVNVDVPTKTIDLRYADDAALLRAKEMLDEIGYPVTQS